MKRFRLFYLAPVVLAFALLSGLLAGNQPALATGGTREVSLSTAVTSGNAYDRNPSFLHAADGSYYLFFTRSEVSPCVRPACDPDNTTYNIFYMTSPDGLNWTTPVQLSDRTGISSPFYGRTVAATQDTTGKIWVFWTSGGNSASVYYYTYAGATWSARSELNDRAYFNAEAVATPDGKVWLFYEDGGASPGVYSRNWDGTTWSVPALVAANKSIPKAIYDAGTFRLVMVDGNGEDFITASTNGTTWTTPTSVAAPANGVTNWDPTIFKDAAGNYDIFLAPDLGTGAQRIAWTQSTNGTTWPGTNTSITTGSYGANTWWDYWPEAGQIGSTTYLFYTSEDVNMARGSGHIQMTKVYWSPANNHYDAIQPALDAAAANDTINVAAGTYTEQLDINKALTLHGAGQGSTIVRSPAALATKYTTSYAHKPVVFVHGANAVVQNLTIDGAGLGNNNNRMMGVDFHNAGGTLDHTTIVHVRNTPFDGIQAGVALYALNDDNTPRTLNVDHNTVSDYQKGGMVFSGAGLTANITNNTVTGAGPTSIIAQNGIQVSTGATALLNSNTVSGHSYTPFSVVSAGMLLFQADTQVVNNILTENQVGIYHTDGASTDSGNTISATGAGTGSAGFWGIIMDAPPANRQPSPFDAASRQNKSAQPASIQSSVATNNILNSDGSTGGIAVETDGGYGAADIDFSASGNTINHWDDGIVVYQCPSGCTGSNFSGVSATHNTVTNNNIGLWVDGGHISGSIHFNNNQLAGNSTYGVDNTAASTVVDAINNWWGAANGPAPTGSGDRVSSNVTYTPFATSSAAYAHLAPNTPITVSVGTTFSLDLLVNAGPNSVIAQQSYLTFTNALLQNNAVSPDANTFSIVLQNQVDNTAGSIAYASSVDPQHPGGANGDFRVAQVTFAANAVGDATLHWQFSPPAPANRNSKVIDANGQTVSDPTLYQDYVIHIVHPQFTGHVTWEGRDPLYPARSILPITLTLTRNGTDYVFNTTTDANGYFSVDVNDLPNGTYTWRVKGPQYLSTSGGPVTLSRVPNPPAVEMGLQPVGDANNDNLVDITDFGILYATFQHSPIDPRADFNGDGSVDIVDFSLLRGNFGRLGNRPGQAAPPKAAGGSAMLQLRPAGKAPANGGSVHVGDRFTLELWVVASPGTSVAAQQSYLSFPATQLQLGSTALGVSTPGTPAQVSPDNRTFEVALQNQICNGPAACVFGGTKVPAGSLAFASGTLGATPGSGAFRVGTVSVQATAPGEARLHWQFDAPARNTGLVTDGATPVAHAGQFVDYVLTVLPAGK